jgi:signal transduction histidine kinase
LERLKADEKMRHIPVIVISALGDIKSVVRGIEMGAEEYLPKPFDPVLLKARLGACLEKKRLHDLELGYMEQLEREVQARTADLRVAYERLQRLERNKTDFIQIAAHELRTPLTVLRGCSDMLLVDRVIKESEYHHQVISSMHSGAMRMQDVVDVMVDMARIDSRTLEFHPGLLVIEDLFENVCHSFEDALVERKQTLIVEGITDLPTIEADAEAMKKVFYHLIVNAIKYTPDGGTITISGRRVARDGEPEMIEIVVRDTGIGIDPQFHELIFEKFYQTEQVALHSSGKTRFKAGGPGLGLSIARGIVRAHDGKIWVESAGHDEETCPGSEFHVLLPVRRLDPNVD